MRHKGREKQKERERETERGEGELEKGKDMAIGIEMERGTSKRDCEREGLDPDGDVPIFRRSISPKGHCSERPIVHMGH